MPFFKTNDKTGNRTVNFTHIDGLPNYKPIDSINVTIDTENEVFLFRTRVSKRPEINLAFNKVLDISFASEQEITSKDKSVIGRAAIGSLLAGPLGALVGGMSGIGAKQKKETKNFIFITYISDGIEKTIVLQIVGASLGWDKFYKEAKAITSPTDYPDKISL